MSSRLDRLFLLLDQGSSHITRRAAALQLGEVQRLHPHELNNLIAKVRHYLHSNSWETRIAASQAIEAIITYVPAWFPPGVDSAPKTGTTADAGAAAKAGEEASTLAMGGDEDRLEEGRMEFSNFDINKVIDCGRDLLASEGSEFDVKTNNNGSVGIGVKEKLANQRRLLNERLGLDVVERLNLGITSNDIVSNEDLAPQEPREMSVFETRIRGNADVQEMLNKASGKMKRKQKERSHLSGGPVDAKKVKTEEEQNNVDTTVDLANLEEMREWPLESFSDELMVDLFSASWEIRHGSSTALREIVKHHGKSGGRTADALSHQMDRLNQLWLEDLALRLLCVLALDKFGDYVSDQVVAPVRETCAQTLGSVFNVMSEEGVLSALQILTELLRRPEWEARHGGLLGVKYLLAVRQDLNGQLLPIVFQPVFNRLKDPVDDVSAVAAAALVPVKDMLKNENIPLIVDYLWDALLEIDDLTSSTSNILMLLSSLLTYNQDKQTSDLRLLVPRLWPFLSHNLSSVRKSVLEALLILTNADSLPWLDSQLLGNSLCLLYQRCLVENNQAILCLLYEAWKQIVTKSALQDLLPVSCQFLSGWICLMMHPSKIPIDSNTSPVWLQVSHKLCHPSENHVESQADAHKVRSKYSLHNGSEKYYLGGSESLGESHSIRDRCVFRARIQAAKCIGLLAVYITKPMGDENPTPLESFANILLFHLSQKSSTQRTCIALIVNEWARFHRLNGGDLQACAPTSVLEKCMECLQELVYFDEIASAFSRLQHEARDFVATLKQHKFVFDENVFKPGAVYTFDHIKELTTSLFHTSFPDVKKRLKPKAIEALEERRRSVARSLEELTKSQNALSTTTLASLANAVVSWEFLPEKLNPIIRPIMDSLKKEENEQLQQLSAVHLVLLMNTCCQKLCPSSAPSPVPKIVKNLITFLCCDSNFTPPVSQPYANFGPLAATHCLQRSTSSTSSCPVTPTSPVPPHGIITLFNMKKATEKAMSMRRSNSVTGPKKAVCSQPVGDSATAEEPAATESSDEIDKENELVRRGATLAICEMAKYFGEAVPTKLPQLWESISRIATESENLSADTSTATNLVQSLQVLEVIALHLDQALRPHLEKLLPNLCLCLENKVSAVRHLASRCFGVFSTIIPEQALEVILESVLGMLGATDNDTKRQGSVEAVACVIEKLGIGIVPYVVLLIVPMLGRMSDQNDQVRLMATHCFAQLIQLMPLDTGKDSRLIVKPELFQRKQEERHFLEQLINPKKLDDYKLPISVNAELRSYQQEGVNWLAFLNRYKLHGILCDEMGLGKTLMSICILAADHFYRYQRYKDTKSPDSKPLPSLVVCPPTLTGHWVYEVEKFVNSVHLNPMHYTGPPSERNKLRDRLKKPSAARPCYNLVIASYDIVRNDIDFFSSLNWNYCILDEGHIIKNGKTKLSKAIKSLSANHRLILTGTPIQNNVIELHSLFDFLMPGFLGTERQFMARYSRPILQSRDAKSSSKEQEAGVLAMEALHRQVLPFVLRRMKEDVLKDLPPKIIQDYYCELSPLQSRLYEDFAKSRVRQNMEENLNQNAVPAEQSNSGTVVASHIFQALQYLRKVCNHPKLVLTLQHPEYEAVTGQLKEQNTTLSDISHAAKLCALKQLLLDCGIGCQSQSQGGLVNCSEPVVNQHRALIFCQLKSMLDIVETDLLKRNMPSVSYLRLDGSVPPGSRHSVVHRFNNDPSIDVLLLTTQVGGLGLNLTGADTVIFVEHDWNPMKDLQAMDRAHRIGQKKVVNVYRLITTGTLEEKIMGLQKFKITIANTVISQENTSLQTMGTEQLLDLFTLDSKNVSGEGKDNNKSKGVKSVLENLPELWDAEQYDSEYDLSTFIKSLDTAPK